MLCGTCADFASQPGMSASTPLTHALRRQGFNIPAKKGKQGKASKESDEEDSGDEH